MQQLFFSEPIKTPKAVNVASVPQRSPFRYPGGKTWFVPRLREWLRSLPQKPTILVEPFAGGGIISLTAAAEYLVERVHMTELDAEISAVWKTIFNGSAKELSQRILEFELNSETVKATLDTPVKDTLEHAFHTILKNRTNHGGILAAGSGQIKNGESGKGIRSRWYPNTLARRIIEIDLFRHRITFEQADAFKVLNQYRKANDAVFFIDPPYTAGGKKAGSRLYKHSELDHETLFRKCIELKGDFIMTYDNSAEVNLLAKQFGLQAKPIPMRNTHHAAITELVIGRDLSWMH